MTKCIGFAARLGFENLVITNLFAYRATDPNELIVRGKKRAYVVGPENAYHIMRVASTAHYSGGLIVAAWGHWGSVNERDTEITKALQEHQWPVWCFGFTHTMARPLHPSRIGYSSELVRY